MKKILLMHLVLYMRNAPLSPFFRILGRHAGTALHHAAKRGLQSTVKLLLVHGGALCYLSNS